MGKKPDGVKLRGIHRVPLDLFLAAALAAGLGNAAFHVGAGLETLSVSREKASPLGLFVSPGAVGLFCGTALGKGGTFPAWLAVILLLFAAAALLLTKTPRPVAETSPELPPFRAVGLPLLGLLQKRAEKL